MEAILESFHSMGLITMEKVKSLPLMEIEKRDKDVIKNSPPKRDFDDWPPPAVDMSLLMSKQICTRSEDRANRVVTYISDHIYVISPN